MNCAAPLPGVINLDQRPSRLEVRGKGFQQNTQYLVCFAKRLCFRAFNESQDTLSIKERIFDTASDCEIGLNRLTSNRVTRFNLCWSDDIGIVGKTEAVQDVFIFNNSTIDLEIK